jgi:HK97 family phage prohead protease
VSKMEQRVNVAGFEIREESDGMHFTGYAALFDSPSEPLPFTERIAKGAFKRSLRSRNDIKFLWNHDSGEILGSTRARTMTLSEDDRGLKVEGMLPNTSRGRDVAELLRRGDVDAMSFGFSVPQGGDTWSNDGSERTLRSVRLHEVSVVAWPAYTATAGTVSVRKFEETAKRADVNAEALADALGKIEDGLNITTDEQEMLSRVIDTLAPEVVKEAVDEVEVELEAEQVPKGDLAMLALKKLKLQLLDRK